MVIGVRTGPGADGAVIGLPAFDASRVAALGAAAGVGDSSAAVWTTAASCSSSSQS